MIDNRLQPGTDEPEIPVTQWVGEVNPALHSTVPLPDGVVIGGPWPHTIITWPGGKSRPATKVEHDLFQALEKANAEAGVLRASIAAMHYHSARPKVNSDTDMISQFWSIRDECERCIPELKPLRP